jgi:hypothetical protein
MSPSGAELLQAVVQVGQVDQLQAGPVFVLDGHGRPPDPLAGGDGGGRPPELEQGELAEIPVEALAQLRRLAVAVRQLAAVGQVEGARRHA